MRGIPTAPMYEFGGSGYAVKSAGYQWAVLQGKAEVTRCDRLEDAMIEAESLAYWAPRPAR